MKTVVNGRPRLACGEETLVEIARTYNVSHTAISRIGPQCAAEMI
jgi:hypothetical protein